MLVNQTLSVCYNASMPSLNTQWNVYGKNYRAGEKSGSITPPLPDKWFNLIDQGLSKRLSSGISYLRIFLGPSMQGFQAPSTLILLSLELVSSRCRAFHEQKDASNPLHTISAILNLQRIRTKKQLCKLILKCHTIAELLTCMHVITL